jgi:outer membrane protein assembly factor BamA
MSPRPIVFAAWLTLAVVPSRGDAQPLPTIATIQVQGNVLTSEEEIVRMSGVSVGSSFEDATLEAVASRLRSAERFQRVDVLKRFASIADPSQIALVIIVDEGPVTIERSGGADGSARLVRSRSLRLLFLPILRFEEGYGFSYGLRLGRADPLGPRSHLSIPLTWGGERRAGAQLERRILRGAIQRVELSGGVSHRTHPFYDVGDTRSGFGTKGDLRAIGPVRVDLDAGWDHVVFASQVDGVGRVGAGVTVDTRLDPMLARNAVYLRGAWAYLETRHGPGFNTSELDVRGYLGLVGQTVLVARAFRDDASRSRPAYLKPMMGGPDILRGFRVGSAIGDSLAGGALELRAPVTSPLKVAKIGVSLFVDVATVYDEGEQMRNQRFERGVGGAVWLSAAFVRLTLSVARGIGHGTRVNALGSLAF